MQSHSITLAPHDSRCRYWAKVVRAGQSLPLPADATSAYAIAGAFLKKGQEELFVGDVLFEGEANHHRRTDRGWTYDVTFIDAAGKCQCIGDGFGAVKARLKEQGLAPELLAGSGDIAAMVRIAHAVRAGLSVDAAD